MIPVNPLRLAKLAGAAVCLAVLGYCGWVVHSWKQKADRLPQLQAQLDEANQFLDQYEKDIREVLEADRVHQAEIEMLRAAARNERIPVVRLCIPADPPVRRLPAAPGLSDEAAPGAGELPQEADGDLRAGPDISPELYAEADRADEIVAQARAAQKHALECSSQ